MTHINFDVPDHIHDRVKYHAEQQNVPMRLVYIETMREKMDEEGVELPECWDENTE